MKRSVDPRTLLIRRYTHKINLSLNSFPLNRLRPLNSPTSSTNLQINVNGKPFGEFPGGSLGDLTRQLELPARQIAVEVNELLIPREQHDAHPLQDGDAIEIVTLVGGG